MAIEREEVTEVPAFMGEREYSTAFVRFISQEDLVETVIRIYPKEWNNTAFMIGDDHVEQAEIVFVEITDWPENAPFLALVEDERTERETIGILVKDRPDGGGTLLVGVIERPKVDGIATDAAAQWR